MVAGVHFQPNQVVRTETMIPVVNVNLNEYSPWHDLAWTPEMVEKTLNVSVSVNSHFMQRFLLTSLLSKCSSEGNVVLRSNHSEIESEHEDPYILDLVAVRAISAGEAILFQCPLTSTTTGERETREFRLSHSSLSGRS